MLLLLVGIERSLDTLGGAHLGRITDVDGGLVGRLDMVARIAPILDVDHGQARRGIDPGRCAALAAVLVDLVVQFGRRDLASHVDRPRASGQMRSGEIEVPAGSQIQAAARADTCLLSHDLGIVVMVLGREAHGGRGRAYGLGVDAGDRAHRPGAAFSLLVDIILQAHDTCIARDIDIGVLGGLDRRALQREISARLDVDLAGLDLGILVGLAVLGGHHVRTREASGEPDASRAQGGIDSTIDRTRERQRMVLAVCDRRGLRRPQGNIALGLEGDDVTTLELRAHERNIALAGNQLDIAAEGLGVLLGLRGVAVPPLAAYLDRTRNRAGIREHQLRRLGGRHGGGQGRIDLAFRIVAGLGDHVAKPRSRGRDGRTGADFAAQREAGVRSLGLELIDILGGLDIARLDGQSTRSVASRKTSPVAVDVGAPQIGRTGNLDRAVADIELGVVIGLAVQRAFLRRHGKADIQAGARHLSTPGLGLATRLAAQ